MKTTNKYYMSFEEAQEYVSKRGLDVPWNDCDVFIDEREITRTVGNVLKWADKTMIDKACEWLKENIEGGVHPQSVYGFVDKFRKAMDEEVRLKKCDDMT